MQFVRAEELLLLEVLSETGTSSDRQQDEPHRQQPRAIRQIWSHCRTMAKKKLIIQWGYTKAFKETCSHILLWSGKRFHLLQTV